MSLVDGSVPVHPDFAGLVVRPGESHLTGESDRFRLVNLLALGAEPDRPTHVPVEVARLGTTLVWESTGSSAALPFWNTQHDADAWLLLLYGTVRVEFKEPGTRHRLGHQLARTGDLLKLPAGVAHRTFSGDGKRRISLELLSHDPRRDTPPRTPVAGHSERLGELTFEVTADEVLVRSPSGLVREPRHWFGRALRALVAHDLHLGHNELLGGLIVDDHGAEVSVIAGGHEERVPGAEALGVFAGLLGQLHQSPGSTP